MGLFADVKAVYRSDGAAVLFTKTLRTLLEPIVGTDTAWQWYYFLNRALIYRYLNQPTASFDCTAIEIGHDPYQTFCGYYNQTPFCPENRRVLYNRTKAEITPVDSSEILELCYYDLKTNQSNQFGTTTTWNWQTGCRLQWYGRDTVIYNTIFGDRYGAVIQNVETGTVEKEISYPVSDIKPDSQQAVSVNFSRLERLHSDYGYTNLPDQTEGEPTPEDDGLFILDLDDGTRELLVSLEELATVIDTPPGVESYIMNPMISPDGKRVSFLYRYHLDGVRQTALLCATIDNGDLTVLRRENEASHQAWRSEFELLSTINYWENQRKTEYVLYDLQTGEEELIEHPALSEDTHPSFAPDNPDLFVGDSYPDHCGNRSLFLYWISTSRSESLGSVYGPVRNGIKRDLHPRWDRNGNYICIDLPRPDNSQSVLVLDIKSALE